MRFYVKAIAGLSVLRAGRLASRYPENKMIIEPLGELKRDLDIEEWLVSANVSVPYLGGESLQFTVEGMEDDDSPEGFVEAVRNFLSLTENDRQEATPYVFQNYRRFVEAVGEDVALGSDHTKQLTLQIKWLKIVSKTAVIDQFSHEN